MDASTVQTAVDELIQKGQPVSVRKVHALTGGSLRDISRLLGEIKSQQADETPGTTRKVYRCERYPSLRIGSSIQFTHGCYETSDPVQQRIIEGAHGFGAFIHAQTTEARGA